MSDPVTILCDACQKAMQVPEPCTWRDWMENRRDTSLGDHPNFGERWSLMAGGQFGRDYIVCSSVKCVDHVKQLTPEQMSSSGYTLGDYVGFFWPETGALPDRVLHGWPPPKPMSVRKSDQIKLANNRVFLAGPLMGSGGEQQRNVRASMIDADLIVEAGYIPFIPHLYTFWDLVTPHGRDHWLRLNKHWLMCCGALVRRFGESVGADLEVEWAQSMGIPVFTLDVFLKLRPAFKPGFQQWAGPVDSGGYR